MLRRIPTLLALVLALEANASESCRIVLEGLDRELKENVMAHLGAAREGESAASLARRLQIAAADGLRALGYYEPDIRLAVNNGTSAEAEVDAKDKTACTITAHIKAGRRVTLLTPDIVISGEAADDPDFKALAASAKPAGTPLNHADYEEFKQRIEALAMQKGYFDGAFSLTALEVLVSKAQARWRLHYDSKARFRFGPVQFKGSQIEEKYLSGIIPFETGAYYDYPVYAELSNNLSQTGWFASVALEPDFEAARKDAELHLPVTARVTPRKQNIVETGLGFATDVGPPRAAQVDASLGQCQGAFALGASRRIGQGAGGRCIVQNPAVGRPAQKLLAFAKRLQIHRPERHAVKSACRERLALSTA